MYACNPPGRRVSGRKVIPLRVNGLAWMRGSSVADAPISSFELSLPEGPHSGLAAVVPAKAKGNLCGQSLTMPTTITGQNGAQVKQGTKIKVTGCPKRKGLTRAQKLAKALKACRRQHSKRARIACERLARRSYGAGRARKR